MNPDYLPVRLMYPDAEVLARLVDDDGILIIDDSEPCDGDPLALDNPLCPSCRGPLSTYEGEAYCPDCLAFGLGNSPRPAA